METVSTEFRTATTADSRETKAQVWFLSGQQTFIGDFTSVESSNAEISGNLDFKYNGDVSEPNRFVDKIASFEQDRLVLDGSFYLPRKTLTYKWWGDELADENGEFTSNPYFMFDSSLYGNYVEPNQLTILWGQNEYAIDYNVITYLDDSVENTYTYTNNTSRQSTVSFTIGFANKVKIEIVKWSLPYGRAKIQHIDGGFTKQYTDEEIGNIKVIEQNDINCFDIPSNECSVTIDNFSREFDILNPTGNYVYLTDYAPLTIQMGHVTTNGVELINMGKFYIKEYRQEKGSMTFNGTDIIGKLEGTNFYGWGKSNPSYGSAWEPLDNGGNTGDYTIKQVIYRLMEKIGLRTGYWKFDPLEWVWENQFIVSNDLDIPDTSTIEPFGWENPSQLQTARDLLKRIGLMYTLKIWVDRDGYLRFDKNEYLRQIDTYGQTTPTNIIELEQSKDYPIVEQQEVLYKINLFAEYYNTDSLNRNIIVNNTTYNFTEIENSEENGYPSDVKYVDIYLDKYATELADFVSAPVTTGSLNIIDFVVYGWKIRIRATGTGTATFAIDDVTYNFSNEFNRIFTSPMVSSGYTLDLYHGRAAVDTGAGISANMFLIGLISKYVYTYDWRQSLVNNLGDVNTFENDFDLTKTGTIVYQEYNYDGGLSGITKGVGA